MLNVLLAIDQNLTSNGIKSMLQTSEEISIVDEASDTLELFAALQIHTDTNIILIDLAIEDEEAVCVVKKIRDFNDEVKVTMLSKNSNMKYISVLFNAGLCGYLPADIGGPELLFALNHVERTGKYLSTAFSEQLLDNLTVSSFAASITNHAGLFSEREMEVLQLIGEGLTNSEISEKIFLSKRTVEGHRQSLIDKTSSRNTAALVRYALLNRLIR